MFDNNLFGIWLEGTRGHSKAGSGHQYYVFAPDWFLSRYLPYSRWRMGIRAWSYKEAAESASKDKRVERLFKEMFESEYRRVIGEG